MKSLIALNLVKKFKKRTVVKDVSIKVNEGEIISILGPNGAGKTTTFSMILGFYKADKGKILLNGENISDLPIYKRAKKGISFLPQEPSIFKGLSVYNNIKAVTKSKQEKRGDIKKILKEMDMDRLSDRKAFQLSGGERRRLEIARSLILNPQFLLLDEPFAGIDPIQINEIKELIKSLKKKRLGIIITDHNVREILNITDRAYIINKGKVICSGTSEELLQNKEVREQYLGKEFRW